LNLKYQNNRVRKIRTVSFRLGLGLASSREAQGSLEKRKRMKEEGRMKRYLGVFIKSEIIKIIIIIVHL